MEHGRHPLRHLSRGDGSPRDPLDEAGLRQVMEQRGYRVRRHVYPPGTRFPAHCHTVDKLDAVVAGRLVIRIDDIERELGPGDMLAIPAGQVHAAWVTGDQAVISLDGIQVLR